MLSSILGERMRKEGLSLRKVAELTGSSHTTISRILHNKHVDLLTIKNVCQWLGVSTSEVLQDRYDYNPDEDMYLALQISMIIKSNTSLSKSFGKVMKENKNLRLSKSDIDEILSFIAFKLSLID